MWLELEEDISSEDSEKMRTGSMNAEILANSTKQQQKGGEP